MNFSLKNKLLVVLLPIFFGAILIVSYLNFITASKTLKMHIMGELHLYSESKALHINDFLEHIKARAIDFSSDGFIRDSAKKIQQSNLETDISALSKHLLENKMILDQSIYGILVIGNNGRILASSDNKEVGVDEVDDDYFIKAKDLPYGTAYASDVVRFEKYHFGYSGSALTASAPLTDKDTGEKIGVLVNYIKISELNRVVTGRQDDGLENISGTHDWTLIKDTNEYLKTVEVYLVNSAGLMITQSSYLSDTSLRVPININQISTCSLSAEGKPYSNYRGTIVVGVFTCLPNGWTLVAEIPEEKILTDITVIRRSIFWYALIVVILMGLFLYFFAESITRPLSKLAEVARKIGKGKFDVRATVSSSDETGMLATVFNDMAKQLTNIYGGLETTISEKTKSLTEKIVELENTKKVMMSLLEDVAHEKEDSAKLAADLEKFKLAVDNASDSVVITDINGSVLYVNNATHTMTGYSLKDISGGKANIWGRQMSAEFYKTLWQTIKIEKKAFHGEIVNKKKWGELYTVDAFISPIVNAGGEVLFFIGIERDITKAKEIDKAKSELVSLASHQLRTPLTSTNWYTELLRENYGDTMTKPQKELVDEIYKSNKRMVRLVNALLNVSRIDMGTLERHPTLVPICTLVDEAIKDLRGESTKKNITVKSTCKKKDIVVYVDHSLMLNVLQNILENAIKYAPSGSSVIIKAEQKVGTVVLSIHDEGCGIPDSQKDKIFTKMFRADNARKIDPDGTGLGLYLVKSIVEQSGGSVWFESEENKGTTFVLELPITKEIAEEKAVKGVFSHHD